MQIQGKYRCINCFKELNNENEICSCGYRQSSYKSLSHWLAPGTVLDNRYYIGRVIGEGGFGITYVGFDGNLERKIAIKEFFLSGVNLRNTTISNDINIGMVDKEELYRTYRDKFVNEAKALAKFNDEEGIVSVINFFMSNNTAYIVMEFLEGETLKEYLRVKKKLSIDETISIFLPMMRTLGAVHAKNLIHRDISPDNIIFTKKGKVKLLDFGSAREVSDGNKSLSVVLKHGYAPFEQYQRHGKQGPWTDVYALSATMYECMTGKRPIEAVDRTLGGELEPVHEIASDCSKMISDVIMKGLEIRTEQRYQNMGDMADALMLAHGGIDNREKVINIKANNRNSGLADADVGDVVEFGNYKGHTRWKVLNRNSNELLLIANEIQERLPFHNKNEECNWKNSSLRKWMNDEYYNQAFNENQKAVIKPVNVDGVYDKVVLLSKEEAEILLKNKAERKSTYDGYLWFWWVNSDVSYNGAYYCACYVSEDGYALDGIRYIGSSRGGVRPVICIDATKL